jgi:hypothetical protein
MAREALELMHEQRWREAQSLLARAYRLVPAPTIAELEGRSLEAMGRLLEAMERYVAATKAEIGPRSPRAFRRAMREAADAIERLEPKIPKLTVVLDGPVPEGASVEIRIDGEAVERAQISTRPVDPGEHVVAAAINGRVMVEDHVLLQERDRKKVVLGLPAVPPQDRREPERVPVSPPETKGGSPQTWGWAFLGVGAAGVTVGAVAGVVMLDAQSELDDGCKPECPRALEADLSRFRTARAISSVGYVVGAIGLVTGAGVLLLTPAPEPEKTGWNLWSDAQVVGVEGTF